MKPNQLSWLSEDEREYFDVIANDKDPGWINQEVEDGHLNGWEAAFILGDMDGSFDDAS